MHQIELIRRPESPLFLARVFDYTRTENGLMVFVSRGCESREAAIEAAQAWAIATLRGRLKVARLVEEFDIRHGGGKPRQPGRRAKNWLNTPRRHQVIDQGNP